MKLDFLFHNDKSTNRDEVYLFLFILVCIGIGVLLWVAASNIPDNWIISESLAKGFGVLWILIGVMFVPGLIYRLKENDTTQKSGTDKESDSSNR